MLCLCVGDGMGMMRISLLARPYCAKIIYNLCCSRIIFKNRHRIYNSIHLTELPYKRSLIGYCCSFSMRSWNLKSILRLSLLYLIHQHKALS